MPIRTGATYPSWNHTHTIPAPPATIAAKVTDPTLTTTTITHLSNGTTAAVWQGQQAAESCVVGCDTDHPARSPTSTTTVGTGAPTNTAVGTALVAGATDTAVKTLPAATGGPSSA